MAVLKKLVLISFVLALIFTHEIAAASIEVVSEREEEVVIRSDDVSDSDSSSVLKIELEQLKSKIVHLESHVDEKTQQLRSKEEIINQKEKLIQEKSERISHLQNDVSSLQEKGAVAAKEQVGQAHERADELEKLVVQLKKETELQQKEKSSLEVRASDAEKMIDELKSKLANLQKINDEQKIKIRKIERALHVAEEEMIKAKYEANSKANDLIEVHGAWLPPWLAARLISLQSFIEMHWIERGKPVMEMAMKKSLEAKAQAEKWAEPHLDSIKTTWIPAVKEQYLAIATYAEPRVQLLTTKSIEVYEASKSAINAHIIKAREFANPHFQEVKKFSKPYIDQVATVTKPHIEKARLALNPYTQKTIHAYGKFIECATTYHHQIQKTVRYKLKMHDLTRPLATKEFVWFVASASLALPVIILFRGCSTLFCRKKAKKPIRNAHTNHARRKARRGHSDK